ncbi:MAG: MlaD family protein [Longimicrobiales bacterium]
MSIRANPTAIGLFMIGAIVLMVTGVVTLASAAWFQSRTSFISFFEESVNGLDRGAPVKFQGVPVGTVKELKIQIDETNKAFQVPVVYEIDLDRLTTELGDFIQLDAPDVLRKQIADGLRAQLQMESFVTGQLYIELKYRADALPPELESRPTEYPEIPTSHSMMAQFGTEAGSLIEDVVKILFRVNEMLEEVDMKGLNAAVVASARSIESLVDSKELQGAIRELPELTAQVKRMMADMETVAERLSAALEPFPGQMEGMNAEALATMKALRETIEEAHTLLTTDAGIGYQLEQTLGSLRDAAEALRVLSIALERNPDMLIRGKRPPGR